MQLTRFLNRKPAYALDLCNLNTHFTLNFEVDTIECLSIKIDAFKLNNSFHNIVLYINLNTDCHVTWEVVKRDIARQNRKSGCRVLFTGLGTEVRGM